MDYGELKKKWSSEEHPEKPKKTRLYWSFFIIVLTIIFIVYLVWPFNYVLTVINEKNQTVFANLTIKDKDKVVFDGYDHYFKVRLWKGDYQVSIFSKGYEKEQFNISNRIGLKLHQDIIQTKILKPIFIKLSSFSFYDPTRTIRLSPEFYIEGSNILQDKVKTILNYSSSVMYGFYNMTVYTDNFLRNVTFEEDKLLVNNEQSTETILIPNEKFLIFTPKEKENILNFLTDYLNFSTHNYLNSEDLGFPKQFFLYNKSHILSLGDMMFLFCELKTYEISSVSPIFFVPKNFSFESINQSSDFSSCYSAGLDSFLPNVINGKSTSKTVIENLLNRTDFLYPLTNLNSRERKIQIAFSFDIESGRYVRNGNKGPNAISPCNNSIASLGLDGDEIVCDNADFVAWFSPLTGEMSLIKYPYPWVSGIEGFKEIISYSEDYGIPQTFYIVTRDYKAFKQLEPLIQEKLNNLIRKNFIEIGAHTRYHTSLNSFNETVSEIEMNKSKEFLINEFNITVTGFRAPYHSVTDSNFAEFVKALENSGYQYWSNIPAQINFTTKMESKPYSYAMTYWDIKTLKNLFQNSNYIISLAHPWNIFYDEFTQSSDVYLKENLSRAIQARATILTAISDGAIPMKVADIVV